MTPKTTVKKNKPAKCSRSQFAKDFFFKKKAGMKGNKVLTAEAKGGFRFAWVVKAGSRNNEAFLKSFTDKVKSDATEIQELNLLDHCARRKDIFNNEAIISENGFPFYQFVSLKEDEEERSVEEWGSQLTEAMNDSKELFKYPTNFYYGGYLSEDSNPLKYLLNNDLYFFVREFYQDAIDDGTFEEDEETQKDLFGCDYINHTKELIKYTY